MLVLDLFSGIGGFSLGLERAGMETVAFCEIDSYCRKVLAKHWPSIPIHEDIRNLNGEQYRGTVDVVCGGWPCQTFSPAARGRHTMPDMWVDYLRIIREVLPRYIIAENLSVAPWETVRFDLRDLGYRSHLYDFKVPFRRNKRHRTYLLADAYSNGKPVGPIHDEVAELQKTNGGFWPAVPEFVRVDDGVPRKMDRLRCLGNSVWPWIPEMLGRAIMEVA